MLSGFSDVVNQRWEEPISKTKSFSISKQVVWEAYRRVKVNQGAAGVDGQSINDFEVGLKDNLYKIWNRMSSGSYFPPPVRTVDIPKSDGRSRRLGIPTVSDRVAQMVVKMCLEPDVEPIFHPDSYGYISGRSALDAVGVVRERCWRYNWVLEKCQRTEKLRAGSPVTARLSRMISGGSEVWPVAALYCYDS